MDDCNQDKGSLYDIRPEESRLIHAAISLGKLLLSQAEVTEAKKSAIVQMLDFLRDLPLPPRAGFNGEFGFRFDSMGGHNGAWSVSVCPTMFEIYCCGRDDLPEFEWLLCPGAVNHNDLSTAEDWIAQVGNPLALSVPGYSFTIDASVW